MWPWGCSSKQVLETFCPQIPEEPPSCSGLLQEACVVLDREVPSRTKEREVTCEAGPSGLLRENKRCAGGGDGLGGVRIGFGTGAPGLGPSLLSWPQARSFTSRGGLNLRIRGVSPCAAGWSQGLEGAVGAQQLAAVPLLCHPVAFGGVAFPLKRCLSQRTKPRTCQGSK